jgi:hypothetical protein
VANAFGGVHQEIEEKMMLVGDDHSEKVRTYIEEMHTLR